MKKNLFSKGFTWLYHSNYLLQCIALLLLCTLFSETSVAQCSSTITSFPYTEGFETAAAWTSGGTNSSWAWGTPAHPTISSAGGGTKSWCSGGLTGSSYSGAQQSWIESPCFNFSTLSYPWISFKIFWECEYIWDGLVLQYSLNGGSTWANVGAAGDPVNCLNANWFNHNNISNISSSPKHGWCGRVGATSGSCAGGNGSAGWVVAKHCLTALANQSNVKFRFLFGSGTTCNSYDGVAIDDILIQNAPPNAANFSYACSGPNTANFTNLSTQCPTSYNWNFGDPASGSANTSTGQNPSHVFSSAGTYTVSLTSSGPCSAASTTLIPISILSLSVSGSGASCNGASNGSSTVTAGGGIPAYSYTWMPAGGNASVAAGLAAGIYTVFVKDTNVSNCVASLTTSVIQPPAITSTISQANISCNGLANGSVSAMAGMGTAPYSYTWYPMGIASSSINGLSPGTYSLLIKDANNCQAAFSRTITQPAPLSITFSTSNVSCFAGTNGSITAICSGGTPIYTYTWNPPVGSSSSISGLTSGTFSLYLLDANNCSVSNSVFLGQPAMAVGGSILTDTPTCGGTNGSATVIATGGTAGYTYNWSPAGGTFSTASGLGGGVYSVTIQDNLNCTVTITTNILPSLSVSVNVNTTNASCSNLLNGSANALPSGGISPYTYTWFPTPVPGQGNASIGGLAAGNYSLQISDANNCIVSTGFSIGSPPVLSFSCITNSVSCHGGNNGNISVIASGGTPAYSFSCIPSGAAGSLITNLSAGNYTISVKDNNNCSVYSMVSILQPAAPVSAVINHTSVVCYGSSSGAANALVNGGTPGYSYLWFPTGGQSANASGLAPGNYSLQITDQNNCNYTATVALTQPAFPLTVSVLTKSISCFGGSNGGATVTPGGGTPGYTYVWDNFSGTVNLANNLTTGNYSVQVMDLNNCSTIVTFSLSQPPPLTISASASKFCAKQPGTITAVASGGALPLNYNWNGSLLSSNKLVLTLDSSSVCTVFATDSKGCVSNHTIVLIDIPKPLQLIASTNYSVCQGQQAFLMANAIGGDGNYSFLWLPGYLQGGIQNFIPKAGQVYTVSVTDGCSTSKSGTVELKYYPVPSPKITYTNTAGCGPVCVTFSNSPVPLSDLIDTYVWNFGDAAISDLPSPSHCFTKEGNYAIQLSYQTIHGCGGSQILKDVIQVYPKPLARFTTDKAEIDAYYPTAQFLNQSSGAVSYNWFFNTDGSSIDEHPSFTFFDPGEQMVVLIAQNEYGCTDTVNKKIKIEPEFTFFAPNAFSPNGNNLNDVFLPKGTGWNTSRYELEIYDRWGAKIFSTGNYAEGWNGKARGSSFAVQNGGYVWKVKMYDVFNKYHEFIGNVLIEK